VPGVCPECGVPFESTQLVLAGVPNRMKSSSTLRRAVWIVVMVAMIVHWQTWILQIRYGWWMPLAILGILGLAVVWLLLTGPRERKGTERFVVTSAGITRVVPNAAPGDLSLGSQFIPWGRSDAVVVTRISPFWKRVRIGRKAGRTLRDVAFDAGIRCPDGVDREVIGTIRAHLAAAPRPAADEPNPRTGSF